MNRIIEILFLVAVQLAVGGMVLLALDELKAVGIGFFRLISLTFLFVMGIGLWAMPAVLRNRLDLSPTGLMPLFLFGFGALLVIYNLYLWVDGVGLGISFLQGTGTIGLVGILLSAMHYVDPIPLEPVSFGTRLRGLLLVGSFLVSTFVLGSGVLGMLLGHSYLTRPSLSLVPLKKLAKLFLNLIVLEAGLTLLNLLLVPHSNRFWQALLLNNFEGLYLWIRILIGIAAPMLLGWMVVQTVKERATMSATGLFYIAMLMVMVGEVFSRFFLLMDSRFF